MKIILRDVLTGHYFHGSHTWCAEVSGAEDFDSIQAAASLAQEQKLETVNVVLRYEKPTCELALPLASCIPESASVGIKHQRPRPPE